MRTIITLAAACIVGSCLTGCAVPWPRTAESHSTASTADKIAAATIALPATPALPETASSPPPQAPAEAPPAELWSRIRGGLALGPVDDDRIEEGLALHRRYPRHLNRTARRRTAQLTYVLDEITARDYPTELALLPVIESRYNPRATSRAGAAGLWQLMPGTARRLGVESNQAYDGRRDMVASTHAALTYLEILHSKYDGDWLLALAAYNCGDGTLDRVLRNQPDAEPDYWDIEAQLPRETQLFVARLLALANVVHAPEHYDIELPPLPPAPPLEVVEVKAPVDLSEVPAAVGLSPDDFFAINSGLARPAIAQQVAVNVLVPQGTAADARDALKKIARATLANQARLVSAPGDDVAYVIEPGDTLSAIALRHGLSVERLREANGLTSDRIRAGRRLRIPAAGRKLARHQVQPGDSLWSIARRHGTTVRQLQALNELRGGAMLRPGQVIRLPVANAPRAVARDI